MCKDAQTLNIRTSKMKKYFVGAVCVAISAFLYFGANNLELDNVQLHTTTSIDGKSALNVYLGGSAKMFCDVAATYEYISQAKGLLQTTKRSQPQLEVSCNVDGKLYIVSSKQESWAKVTILKGSQGQDEITLESLLVNASQQDEQLIVSTASPILLDDATQGKPLSSL